MKPNKTFTKLSTISIKKKILKIVENLQKIAMITMKTCPIQETEKYVEDKFTAIKQGYYFDNFKKNFFKIAEVVMHEVNNKQKNAYSVGTACAQIEKMTIYKQQQLSQFKFLALESIPAEMAMPDFNIDLEGFKKFFKGVLEGVSKVPFGENICYTSAIDIKIEEVKLIAEHLYAAIKERDGKKFYEAVKEVLAVLEKLENANEHCDISGLIKSIGVYATPYVGIGKLLYNIASHYSLYWGDIKEGYSAFGNKEWEKAGHAIGHFASTLLSWTTS